MRRLSGNPKSGLTLLETLIGVAIIAIVAFSVYRSLTVLIEIFAGNKVRIAATDLANAEMEIIRNIAYQNIGTIGGIPGGFIPPTQTKTKSGFNFLVTATIRNIDDPFDGTLGGNPNDLSPADYKLVELALTCASCPGAPNFIFTGRAAPKNLETASVNGALFIQAIDASGNPVSGATVQISNSTLNPPVNITDVTGIDGFLRVVDVPPAAQTYRVSVLKSGYSSESTYASTPQNPNPVKPDLTVVLQTVTQATFAIDKVSALNVLSVKDNCSAVPNIGFDLSGFKLIGTNPDILKFSQSYSTGGSGAFTVPNLEWDNYNLAALDAAYDIAGTIPYSPINILPNSAQDFRIVMQAKNPLSLLITVKDAATQLPLASTTVAISAGSFNKTLVTGRGFLTQTDWSGGPGQPEFLNPSQYFDQDGNIETGLPAGELKLTQVATSTYAVSGWLTSSSFDTGSPSNFYAIAWQPISQPPATGAESVKFQIATATTTNPANWNYLGPDGTASTFYTASSQNINAVHASDRYLRYRAYLGSASTTFTPGVADVSLTFASECTPPGQVFFTGLAANTYNITISRSGYATVNDTVSVSQSWQEKIYLLSP